MASAITTQHTLIQVEESNGFALQPSRSNIFFALAANTAQNILISDLEDIDGHLPTYLMFAGTGVFYVLWGATGATIPGTTTLTGATAELTPTLRKLGSITQFSIISDAAVNVTVALFKGK